MALKIQAWAKDLSSSYDLTTAPFALRGDDIIFTLGNWTEPGLRKRRNNTRVTEGDRQNSKIAWEQQVSNSTIDLLNSAYQSLKNIICQPEWVFVFNQGGVTEPDKYYNCYEVTTVPNFGNKTLVLKRHKWKIEFETHPYADLAYVDLPKNYVVDAAMCDCFAGPNAHGDYIPNSFFLMMGGTPTYSITQDDGWTKIEVIGGAAGEYAGISQPSIALVAGNLVNERLEFKCTAATGGAKYYADIQETGGSAYPSLIDGRTAAATAQDITVVNRTVSPNTTSLNCRLWIQLTANGKGTFWVRLPAVTKDNALPVGADAHTVGWCSLFSETPATCIVDNLPGDVDAKALIQFGFNGSAHGSTQNDDIIVLGNSYFKNYGSFIKSFTDTTNADCLGGKSSATQNPVAALQFMMTLQGRFQVFARLLTTSTTWANDRFGFEQYSGGSNDIGNPYQSQLIKPFQYPVVMEGAAEGESWRLATWFASNNIFTCSSAHGLIDLDGVILTGGAPGDMESGRAYYVCDDNLTTTTFMLSGTRGGAPNVDCTQDTIVTIQKIEGRPKWVTVFLGEIEFPLGGLASWQTSKADLFRLVSLEGAGGNWWADYVAFLPVDNGYIRAEVGKGGDYMSQLGIATDGIDNIPAVYKRTGSSASVQFPFTGDLARNISENHEVDYPTLKAGVENRLLVASMLYLNSATEVHDIAAGIIALRYMAQLVR